MRIGIDARVFAGGKRTGVEEYARFLLEALFARKSGHTFVLFYNAYADTATDFSWATKFSHVEIKTFHIPNKLFNFSLWYLQYPKIDRLLGVDTFFMPNSNFIALSRTCKLILAVHDLSALHHKETFSWKRRAWHWFVNPRKLIQRADHMIAVSQATTDDLMHTYHIPPEKVTTTHNGKTGVRGRLSRNSREVLTVKEKYHLPYKFILSFGTIEPRKNIIHTVRAFESFRASGHGEAYTLVIAGASGWHSAEIEEAIATSTYAQDIMRITDVPEEDKEALYILADLFVYPSFYEGFGFPTLEALMTQTPVITSHSSSLPEVVGEHAILIDPYRPEEIAIAMEEILTQKILREQLLTNVDHHTKNFTWERVADTFLRNV